MSCSKMKWNDMKFKTIDKIYREVTFYISFIFLCMYCLNNEGRYIPSCGRNLA